ncbi:TetR/AcrR family transcriptional regulator [Demequina subtropica]|uniref:TetR/AcrR family transcriptional regulator n=1 Tax=Demequina subtropica TaxID=1638989 RepID=UPI0007816D9B|nr:TetR/AcrR family transcriptional regulator [Demequina subtropica]
MDVRIVRTRRRLQEALVALASERGLDDISVSDIVAEAGVNRSTFYQHYSDKETLLADALDAVAEEAGAGMSGLILGAAPPEPLVRFLEHVEAHADLYRRVFTEPGYGAVLTRLRLRSREAIRDLAPDVDEISRKRLPVDVVAAGLTGLVLGVVGEWLLAEDRPPAAEAAGWIWSIVLGLPVLSEGA